MGVSGQAQHTLFPALGAFVGATGCWILFGLTTPGDFFANGYLYVIPVLAAAAGIGAYAALKVSAKGFRIALALSAIVFLLFWALVPDGWWASPPPRRSLQGKAAADAGLDEGPRHL